MVTMTYDKENILFELNNEPVFNCLSIQQKKLLSENIHVNLWQKGETIFTQGSEADYLYLWLDGMAQHFIQTPSGLDVFIAVISRHGSVVGISTILEQPYYIYSLFALTEVKAAKIHKSLLNQLRKENPKFSQELLSIAAQSIYRLSVQVEQSATFTASQKVICYVLRNIADLKGTKDIKIDFVLEKKTLASLLQVTPETLSRTLNYLKELGLHVYKDYVQIDDLAILQRISCSNCSQITIGSEGHCVGR
ncbi:MAG: Crp/Fnr family transcriptional regulator [Alphaproteobacteria bacterium]